MEKSKKVSMSRIIFEQIFNLRLIAGYPMTFLIGMGILWGACSFSSCTDGIEDSDEFSRGEINGHEYVDLGLSVKWATRNIVDTAVVRSAFVVVEVYSVGDIVKRDTIFLTYDDGNIKDIDIDGIIIDTINVVDTVPIYHFSWGGTQWQHTYRADCCPLYKKDIGNIGGDLRYDIARYRWGGSWRLPTKREFEELQNECKWEWMTMDGVNGYNVIGKNGNSIFLPAAGLKGGSAFTRRGKHVVQKNPDFIGEVGYYWTSVPYAMRYNYFAYGLYFKANSIYGDWGERYLGRSVRPVLK